MIYDTANKIINDSVKAYKQQQQKERRKLVNKLLDYYSGVLERPLNTQEKDFLVMYSKKFLL